MRSPGRMLHYLPGNESSAGSLHGVPLVDPGGSAHIHTLRLCADRLHVCLANISTAAIRANPPKDAYHVVLEVGRSGGSCHRLRRGYRFDVLIDFLERNRDLIISQSRALVAARTHPKPSETELTNGIPVFLDQLGDALRLAESSADVDHEAIRQTAGRHGSDLLRLGLTIAQVVHDYGDVCQTVTELAIQQKAPISGNDFQTLNLCLDDAIAGAVTEYARQRERTIANQGTERLGAVAHELRNLLDAATLAFDRIKSGHVAPAGATGLVLARSLAGLRDLIDRSLTDVRLDAGIEHLEAISVAQFIEEVEIAALTHAKARGIHFSVASVDRTVTIEGDRPTLAAAVSNLLQNAFKFTHLNGHVSLTASTTADRVLIAVEDECGGLPPGQAADPFHPSEKRGSEGTGLGLAICAKVAKANSGLIHVRNIPGKGCVFTLDLPRKPPPPLSLVEDQTRHAG
jgi:signal transduction histidine kinase